MANYVSKVIKIAEAEVGYLEKASNKNLYDKTANAGKNNYTKYGKEMHELKPSVMDFPAAWCDAFVDWCFYKAYGKDAAKKLLCGDFDDYTPFSAQYYKNEGRFHKSDPQIGDQIFFKDSSGTICHTGIVYRVTTKKVYTIEGNTSGASDVVANGGGVCKKSYPVSNTRIAGYGRPAYEKETTTTTTTKKTVEEVAKEVMDGKWGNGSDRKNNLKAAGYDYEEVQAKVNELAKGNATTNYLVHTVSKGDTLWGIAEKYLGNGKRYGEIMKLNKMATDFITVGQKLNIPAK